MVDGPLTQPCDYPEAVLNSSFDFEGPKEPMVFATENDVLNSIGMLFMELLTNRADLRRRAHLLVSRPPSASPATTSRARRRKTAASSTTC